VSGKNKHKSIQTPRKPYQMVCLIKSWGKLENFLSAMYISSLAKLRLHFWIFKHTACSVRKAISSHRRP